MAENDNLYKANLVLIRDPNTVNKRIFIGNLPTCTRDELESICAPYGKVLASLLQKNFGFVQYDSEETAIKAASALNKSSFKGNNIVVRIASDKQKKQAAVVAANWQNNAPQPTSAQSATATTTENGNYNDCEIIVVDRKNTKYAEMIEDRLKRLSLRVDVLFPNEDVPLGKVLSNIASRGCLYAILVTNQHEEHNSITVNILYGQPAEHRNMPVDDAIKLIATDISKKRFRDNANAPPDAVQQQQPPIVNHLPNPVPIIPAFVTPTANERPPHAIQTLINLLANNMPLTVLQYDRIIKHLQERRELQAYSFVNSQDMHNSDTHCEGEQYSNYHDSASVFDFKTDVSCMEADNQQITHQLTDEDIAIDNKNWLRKNIEPMSVTNSEEVQYGNYNDSASVFDIKSDVSCIEADNQQITQQLTDEEIAKANKKWLRKNIEPMSEVLSKWENTYNARCIFIKNNPNINKIFDDWPIYQQPFGATLILSDFAKTFPEKDNLLITKWEHFCTPILKILDDRTKDKEGREILNQFKANDYDSDIRNSVILNSIHNVLKPNNKKRTIVNDKLKFESVKVADSRSEFIQTASTISELNTILNDKIKTFVESNFRKKKNVRPFICTIGTSVFDYREFYVYFGKTFYQLTNLIECVDLSFKIFKTFNIEYPDNCKQVWLFIQQYFFEIDICDNEKTFKLATLLQQMEVFELLYF